MVVFGCSSLPSFMCGTRRSSHVRKSSYMSPLINYSRIPFIDWHLIDWHQRQLDSRCVKIAYVKVIEHLKINNKDLFVALFYGQLTIFN